MRSGWCAADLTKRQSLASFTDLCAEIKLFLKARHAVLDGEIVCLDENGCSQFNQLLFRGGTARFYAFDVLHLNGKDLRSLPLIEGKRALRKIVPRGAASLLYVDHVEKDGDGLFLLLSLQRFDVPAEIANPLLHFGGMALADTEKYRTPHWHVLGAMRRQFFFSSQYCGKVTAWELAIVLLGQRGQVGRRCL